MMIIYLPPVNPMTAPLTADTRGAIPSQMAIVMSGMFARQNLVPERLTDAEVKKAKQARPTDAGAAADQEIKSPCKLPWKPCWACRSGG